ncbi:MAG: AmpG family muropeptide MFS transporter [Myxococcota bacterium]
MPAGAHDRARLRDLANRRVGVMPLLGFSSGLPLLLTGGTLQAWLTDAGLDVETIGFFTLVGVPYSLKFMWAPVMDRFVPPFLGRRRGWMLIAQLSLAALIAAMALASPSAGLDWIAFAAVALAFASASQDIVLDAYRTDVLREPERGLGAGLTVTGYRLAMLVSGAGALMLADRVGFGAAYSVMAALMAVGVVATLVGPRPHMADKAPRTFTEAVVGPLREFFDRPGVWSILLLVLLYKLADVFASSLSTTFLMRGPGFDLTEIALANKVVGFAALLGGAVVGGALMARIGLFWALVLFGVLQALTNLGFLALALAGHDMPLLLVAVVLENLAGGMGTAAFVSFLMALCDHRYTATQYALLSALAAVGRMWVGPVSGYMVDSMGWAPFFAVSALTAVPGLLLLTVMRETVETLDAAHQ